MQANWQKAGLTRRQALMAAREWVGHALPGQYRLLPTEAIWLVLGGRGAGKTRLGAEWVNALVRGFPPFAARRHMRIALVGETLGDVREIMIEGASGIAAHARGDRPRYEAGRRRLVWENGAVAQAFSSEDPESLRGPQFEAAWCDELAKWRHPQATFDMLQFGLRLGPRPVQLITTTPRPLPLVKSLIGDPGVTVTRLRTVDNAAHLSEGFVASIRNRYRGSRLERQELDGELIEDSEDALWTRAELEAAIAVPGELRRVVVAVDPPASSGRSADSCGIIVAGLAGEGGAVVLEDATMARARPEAWARRVVELYERHAADTIVAEVNQGGEMVAAILRTVDPRVPVKAVRASRGKWLRAEPVAALYQQGRVKHAARFAQLEDEMCNFGPQGLAGGRSPDRLDALVWALSELLLGAAGEPRIHNLS